MNFNYQSKNTGPFGGLLSIVFMGLVFVGLYYLFAAFNHYLAIIAPILLVAALVIRHKVVIGFVQQLFGLLQKMPLLGILSLVIIYFMYPFVAFYLFMKALRKPIPASQRPQNPFNFGPFQQKQQRMKQTPIKPEFTEFEDLSVPEDLGEDERFFD